MNKYESLVIKEIENNQHLIDQANKELFSGCKTVDKPFYQVPEDGDLNKEWVYRVPIHTYEKQAKFTSEEISNGSYLSHMERIIKMLIKAHTLKLKLILEKNPRRPSTKQCILRQPLEVTAHTDTATKDVFITMNCRYGVLDTEDPAYKSLRTV